MMLVLTLFLACTPSGGAGDCAVDLDAGTAEAKVDGESWTGTGVTWLLNSGLQINTERAGGWSMVLRAQDTDAGDAVVDKVEAGELPVTVSLSDASFATLYPESGDSYTSKGAAGELVIAEVSDDALRACFSFEATTEAGDTVTVEGGKLDALPFE